MSELKVVNKYFFKYKYHFIGGIVITIIAQLFALYVPKTIGKSMNLIQDYLQNQSDREQVYGLLTDYLLILIGAALMKGFFTFWMRQTLIVMSRLVEFDMKNEIYAHYQNLSQNFYKKNKIGDLMNRISEDVGKVRMYTGPAMMYGINTSITFIVVIIQMYIISPKLTFYTLLPLPILSYSIFKLSNAINIRSTIYQQNLSKLTSFTQEMFSGIRVIKAYAIENESVNNFGKLAQESKEKNMKLAFLNALFMPLMVFLIGLSNLIVIFVGGMLYINAEISHIGVIAEFILYINMLTWPVASLGWISSMVQEAEASQKRITEFMKVKPDVKNNNPNQEHISGTIAFENVTYRYEDTNIKALDNVSFTLEKGKTLAVLGKTGGGKSTILSLIGRLFDVQEGKILIDNKPIEQLNLKSLRDAIAFVPQDVFLFSDTIKNNILFGNANATFDDVKKVANWAVVDKDIEKFPKQYDTLLGERGINLSGGQKQRVSIARALLKQAQIMLLDDSLSAVDTETEEKILKNIAQTTKGKTTIIVTHRVSTAKNADAIIVIDNGKIIQQGTHEQLLEQEGYYQELYKQQFS
ncbi:MAG: ABC transporter ATP-binding protein [Bacteroidota bacterium]|nr:ABC transporter ATP-binding protein [Bacteroidota bacterium]